MKNKSHQGKKISRRGILPIFGGSLLIPFLGFSNLKSEQKQIAKDDDTDNEYQTLLKPDGTIVKVKSEKIYKSNIVDKNVSNKSFLNWLTKKNNG